MEKIAVKLLIIIVIMAGVSSADAADAGTSLGASLDTELVVNEGVSLGSAIVDTDIAVKEKTEESSYSINLIWINQKINDSQRYILPSEEAGCFLERIANWSTLNPEADIVLWFDGETTTLSAILNTAEYFKKYGNISLKNIRSLPQFKKINELDSRVFSQEISVYFRVDLIRILIQIDYMVNNHGKYFVYADLDVKPLRKDEIFDTTTLKYLKKYGIVLAAGSSIFARFENGFMISIYNENLVKALNKILVNPAVKMVSNFLKEKFRGSLDQAVYNGYGTFFAYLYHQMGLGEFKVYNGKVYDEEKHKDLGFGIRGYDTWLMDVSYREFIDELSDIDDEFYSDGGVGHGPIPTKKVQVPESHFCCVSI